MIGMTSCNLQWVRNTSYYGLQVVHCVRRLRRYRKSSKTTKYALRAVVCLSAVIFNHLGLPVGPVGAGGGATVMGWGGLPGFPLLSSCLFSSFFLSFLPPTITSLLTTTITSSLVLGYSHAWCETVIGLFLMAVQGISQCGGGWKDVAGGI